MRAMRDKPRDPLARHRRRKENGDGPHEFDSGDVSPTRLSHVELDIELSIARPSERFTKRAEEPSKPATDGRFRTGQGLI
jgi:hypothetical protein